MSNEFKQAYTGGWVNWLLWCGQPMIYDGALCVCRTDEDLIDRRQHWKHTLMV